jgi:3-deoxy-7-phosphoheptulonate synthase
MSIPERNNPQNGLVNVNIVGMAPLPTPRVLKAEYPVSVAAAENVLHSRREIADILEQRDHRLLVITGPCSIHDPEAALEYARRLVRLREAYAGTLCIVMRVYFQKPRTTVGWKGLINDPHMDGSNDVAAGLRIARKLLIQINELGLPVATEMLDPIAPQYIADLVSWSAIGARTTESPSHREMASGLSMPVGFKNGTDGSLQIAVDAMVAARTPHAFIGIDEDGNVALIRTAGNPQGHVVLRGGAKRTNYHAEAIAEARERLKAEDLPPVSIVDCSHANSGKIPERQEVVLDALLTQIEAGEESVIGVMLESNLIAGNQKLEGNLGQLLYGVSITDACIGWETTERLLASAHERLAAVTRTAVLV